MGSSEVAKTRSYALGGIVGGPVIHSLAREMGRHFQYWVADGSGTEYKIASPREFSVGDCVKFVAVWAHANQRIWELGTAELEKSSDCSRRSE
jgi:hypothetical protein